MSDSYSTPLLLAKFRLISFNLKFISMSKSKVTIQFTSLTNLWAFRTAIAVNVFEMNMSEISITCECRKEDIELAIEKYKGRLLETQKATA